MFTISPSHPVYQTRRNKSRQKIGWVKYSTGFIKSPILPICSIDAHFWLFFRVLTGIIHTVCDHHSQVVASYPLTGAVPGWLTIATGDIQGTLYKGLQKGSQSDTVTPVPFWTLTCIITVEIIYIIYKLFWRIKPLGKYERVWWSDGFYILIVGPEDYRHCIGAECISPKLLTDIVIAVICIFKSQIKFEFCRWYLTPFRMTKMFFCWSLLSKATAYSKTVVKLKSEKKIMIKVVPAGNWIF